MKVVLYADWPVAFPYLKPLYRYLKEQEPTWELAFWSDGEDTRNQLLADELPVSMLEDCDIGIVCDESSAFHHPTAKRICIFHGLASKGQAYSAARRDAHVNFPGYFAVPSDYYKAKLLNIGVAESKIFVAGLTKFDTLTDVPALRDEPKILYAPTHNPPLSAIPVIREDIYLLSNLTIHLHFYTAHGEHSHHKLYSSYYKNHRAPGLDVTSLIADSDIVIGDFGSVILEAMALGKFVIQVKNPQFLRFYRHTKGLPFDEIAALPEVELPKLYAHDIRDIIRHIRDRYPNIDAQNTTVVENIGNYRASEKIYEFIKAVN